MPGLIENANKKIPLSLTNSKDYLGYKVDPATLNDYYFLLLSTGAITANIGPTAFYGVLSERFGL